MPRNCLDWQAWEKDILEKLFIANLMGRMASGTTEITTEIAQDIAQDCTRVLNVLRNRLRNQVGYYGNTENP